MSQHRHAGSWDEGIDCHEQHLLPTSNARLPQDRITKGPECRLYASTVPFILSASISSFIVILALKLNTLFVTQSSSDWAVDVAKCTCDCWDRSFKGGYNPGGYKHVYFQMSTGASLLWLWTAAHFILLFKFVELATTCVLGSLFAV